MVVPSTRGSPRTTFAARRSVRAAVTASTRSCGTITRRMAVHFWPALTVISWKTAFTNASNSGDSGSASGPRMAALRESVSAVKRTPPSCTFGCFFSVAAVAAEPVNATWSR